MATLNLEPLEMFETSLETEKQQKTSKSRKHRKPSKKDQVWKLAVGRHKEMVQNMNMVATGKDV